MLIIKSMRNFYLHLILIKIINSKLVEFHYINDPNMVIGVDLLRGVIKPVSKIHQHSLTNYCTFAQLRKIHKNFFEIFFCGYKLCTDPKEDYQIRESHHLNDSGLDSNNQLIDGFFVHSDIENKSMNLSLCFSKEHSTSFRLVMLDDTKYAIEKDGQCVTTVLNQRIEMVDCDLRDEQVFSIASFEGIDTHTENGVGPSGNGRNNNMNMMSKTDRQFEIMVQMNENEENFRQESLKGIGMV